MPEGGAVLAMRALKNGQGCASAGRDRRLLRQGTAKRRFPAWSIGNSLDHHHEQYTAFIPPAQPAHAPAIEVIAYLNCPAKPQELRLNMHSPLRTCMSLLEARSQPRDRWGFILANHQNRPVSISVVNQQAIGSNPVWRAKYNPTSKFSPPSG